MGSYGRFGDFLQSPRPEDRLGRFVSGDDIIIPMFAPVRVIAGSHVDGNGQLPLELAAGAQAPKKGFSGIAIFENPTPDIAGLDMTLSRSDDLDYVPIGAACQLVSAPYVRLRLINAGVVNFYGQRTYAARKMVAGLGGATPAIVEGDLLTPGVGDDTSGYWAKTSDASLAWLRVTGVYNASTELDAQFLF